MTLSDAPHQPERDTMISCLDLPFIGSRLLTSNEAERLTREVQALTVRVWFSYFALLFIGFTLLVIIGNNWHLPAMAVAAATFALASAILFLNSLLRQWNYARRTLVADLKRGQAFTFSGIVREGETEQSTKEQLARARVMAWSTEQTLDVLPASGRIIETNGQAAQAPAFARVVEVARTPEIAAIAAQWVEPISASDGSQVGLGHRELSRAERAEVAQCLRRARSRLIWPEGVSSLWLTTLAVVAVWQLADGNGASLFRLFFYVIIAGMVDVSWATRLMLAARLAKDIGDGHVVIFKFPHGEPRRIGAKTVLPHEGAEVISEVLPFSKLPWTQNQHPAAWRRGKNMLGRE